MYEYYFTFRSVTAAKLGSRVLERAGIWSLMVRTPKELRKRGCGYSLRVKERYLTAAKEEFRKNAVEFAHLYRKSGEGLWQEVTL